MKWEAVLALKEIVGGIDKRGHEKKKAKDGQAAFRPLGNRPTLVNRLFFRLLASHFG